MTIVQDLEYVTFQVQISIRITDASDGQCMLYEVISWDDMFGLQYLGDSFFGHSFVPFLVNYTDRLAGPVANLPAPPLIVYAPTR
jgi:hypothetical protein